MYTIVQMQKIVCFHQKFCNNDFVLFMTAVIYAAAATGGVL